jgi:hypothetical protein
MFDPNGDLIPGSHTEPLPGETCEACKRRIPYPKKETSPDSVTRSFRLPTDDAESFNEDLALACRILGITSETKYAPFRFYRGAVQQVITNEVGLRGAFTRGEWD